MNRAVEIKVKDFLDMLNNSDEVIDVEIEELEEILHTCIVEVNRETGDLEYTGFDKEDDDICYFIADKKGNIQLEYLGL